MDLIHMRQVLLLLPLYKWENQVTERLSKWPKVKKTVNDTVDIWIQTLWLQNPGYYLVHYSASLNELPYACYY